MAKSKEAAPQHTGYAEKVKKFIEKEYGKGVLAGSEEFFAKSKQIIPVSPSIDLITNGGIPEGCFVTVSGIFKGGKTSLCLSFAAVCQRPEYGNRFIYYFDVEGRLKEKQNLDSIKGLKYRCGTQWQRIGNSEDGNIVLSQEDYLNQLEYIIKNHPGCVIIIDSISAFSPRKVSEDGIETQMRASHYQTLAKLLDECGPIVPRKNQIVIGVAHVYQNTSGYGKKYLDKASSRWHFQSDVKLKIKHHEDLKKGNVPIGKKTTWECEWSALGPPNLTLDSYLTYGIGLDWVEEIIVHALSIGVIQQPKRGWYCLPQVDPNKNWRKSELYALINADDKLYNALRSEVFEALSWKPSAGGSEETEDEG